ncbi:MAG: hypothetical protein ACKVUT_08470 [Gaiella sp.]
MQARTAIGFTLLAFLTLTLPARASAPLASQAVASRFHAATGVRVRPDQRLAYPGHWVALTALPSQANLGRFGTFTLYVLNGDDAATDLHDLLADGHTGRLGAPGPGNIHWESAPLISGGTAWLAKKRYGANVVLWRYGTEKRMDRSFRELHRALVRVVG